MGAVLSFFRPASVAEGDWSQQELAEFYRVEAALTQSGLRITSDRGISDENDPWFIFCRFDGDVVLHFARIDGRYVVASDAFECPLWGPDFRALLDAVAATHPTLIPLPRPEARGNLVLHPAALLAAIVATVAFQLAGGDAMASELATGDASHTMVAGSDVPEVGLVADGSAMAHPGTQNAEAGVHKSEEESRIARQALVMTAMALIVTSLPAETSLPTTALTSMESTAKGDHEFSSAETAAQTDAPLEVARAREQSASALGTDTLSIGEPGAHATSTGVPQVVQARSPVNVQGFSLTTSNVLELGAVGGREIAAVHASESNFPITAMLVLRGLAATPAGATASEKAAPASHPSEGASTSPPVQTSTGSASGLAPNPSTSSAALTGSGPGGSGMAMTNPNVSETFSGSVSAAPGTSGSGSYLAAPGGNSASTASAGFGTSGVLDVTKTLTATSGASQTASAAANSYASTAVSTRSMLNTLPDQHTDRTEAEVHVTAAPASSKTLVTSPTASAVRDAPAADPSFTAESGTNVAASAAHLPNTSIAGSNTLGSVQPSAVVTAITGAAQATLLGTTAYTTANVSVRAALATFLDQHTNAAGVDVGTVNGPATASDMRSDHVDPSQAMGAYPANTSGDHAQAVMAVVMNSSFVQTQAVNAAGPPDAAATGGHPGPVSANAVVIQADPPVTSGHAGSMITSQPVGASGLEGSLNPNTHVSISNPVVTISDTVSGNKDTSTVRPGFAAAVDTSGQGTSSGSVTVASLPQLNGSSVATPVAYQASILDAGTWKALSLSPGASPLDLITAKLGGASVSASSFDDVARKLIERFLETTPQVHTYVTDHSFVMMDTDASHYSSADYVVRAWTIAPDADVRIIGLASDSYLAHVAG